MLNAWPAGPDKRGRPRNCLFDVVDDDICANGLMTKDTQDRAKW